MFCCWICMRVYEFLWELLREVLWELLREVLWELLRFWDSSCWRCESCWGSVDLLKVWEFFTATFLWIRPKTVNKGHRSQRLFIGNLIFTDTSQNRQNMGTWPISQTWPNRHDHCQTCKPLKIESLRLGFTFSKPSLTDSSLKPSWHPRGIYVELEFLRLEFHVEAVWNFATWERWNRALEARFTASKSSLKGSIC